MSATPRVEAEAARLGVDLATVTASGVGGRTTVADVRRSAPQPAALSRPARSDPAFARNPLADDLERQDPDTYRAALSTGPTPTLFASGDLPPFVASGIDVSLLLDVPWRARPALALMDTRSDALAAYNVWSNDAGLAEVEAGAYDGARQIVVDYMQRFQAWVRQGWAQQAATTSVETLTQQGATALGPVFTAAMQREASSPEPQRISGGGAARNRPITQQGS